MKKLIFRNIAILSAIFIVTLSIMLVTNYFQIKDVTPLQTEVVESLKQLNDWVLTSPDCKTRSASWIFWRGRPISCGWTTWRRAFISCWACFWPLS